MLNGVRYVYVHRKSERVAMFIHERVCLNLVHGAINYLKLIPLILTKRVDESESPRSVLILESESPRSVLILDSFQKTFRMMNQNHHVKTFD